MEEVIDCADWVHGGTVPSCGGTRALPFMGDTGDMSLGSVGSGDEVDTNPFWLAGMQPSDDFWRCAR